MFLIYVVLFLISDGKNKLRIAEMVIKVYAYTFYSNYQLSQFISDSKFTIMVKCHISAALTNAHRMVVGNEEKSLPLERLS